MSWDNPYTSEMHFNDVVRANAELAGNLLLKNMGSPWSFRIVVCANGHLVGGDWRLPEHDTCRDSKVYGFGGKFRVRYDDVAFDTLEEACEHYGVPLYPVSIGLVEVSRRMRETGLTYADVRAALVGGK